MVEARAGGRLAGRAGIVPEVVPNKNQNTTKSCVSNVVPHGALNFVPNLVLNVVPNLVPVLRLRNGLKPCLR